MKTATMIAQMTARVTGLGLILLGLLFWTGNALGLIPVHMMLGFVLVLALWTLAGLGVRAGVSGGFVALAFAWGLILPVVGIGQMQWLIGPWHWVIEVVHLVIGLGAIGQAEGMAKRIGEAIVPAAAVPEA